jgi:hypothetical protein
MVMVMPAIRLLPTMTVIEQVHAAVSVMAPSAKRTTIVVAVVVIDSVVLAGMAVGLGIRLRAHRAISPMRISRVDNRMVRTATTTDLKVHAFRGGRLIKGAGLAAILCQCYVRKKKPDSKRK